MTPISVTTPFGRRSVSLAHMATQIETGRSVDEAARPGSNHPGAVNKWHLFRTLTEVRHQLGVSDRTLSVLNALLSFHQETALTLPKPPIDEATSTPCDLVVFPSNKALCLRAHGMAEPTLRRHLAALVDAGLIVRRDSPNGKRYARTDPTNRDRHVQAFGFDLTPLVVRAPEFDTMADSVRREREAIRLLKERISLFRRDAAMLLACAIDEGLAGDWKEMRQRLGAITVSRVRQPDRPSLEAIERAVAALRADLLTHIQQHAFQQKMSGKATQIERQQTYSNAKITQDFEPASQEAGDADPSASIADRSAEGQEDPQVPSEPVETKEPTLPLGLVLEACPDIRDYGPGGQIRSWPDLIQAAELVRPMLGISPDAWTSARETLPKRSVAAVLASILQRSEHSSEAQRLPSREGGPPQTVVNGSPAIRSPGGYLRALTEKAAAGHFSLGPILMALIGQRLRAKAGRP